MSTPPQEPGLRGQAVARSVFRVVGRTVDDPATGARGEALGPFCSKCGVRNDADASYCDSCGAALAR
jgi:zinc ribbon protein